MVTGSEYLRAITARESDRRARSAFQELVLRTAQPGSIIFDFGAGPGIDAKFYAQRGFRVGAYDVDPQMCETFLQHCHAEMQAGQVQLFQGSYQEFLSASTLPHAGSMDVITANFAPLSLVDAPHELFRRFHELTGSRGKVVVSVLNPYFLGDSRYRWWWSNLPRLWRAGHYRVQGAPFSIYRRTPAVLAAAAAPYFSLYSVERGLPTNLRLRKGLAAKALLLTSLYLFLTFQKR